MTGINQIIDVICAVRIFRLVVIDRQRRTDLCLCHSAVATSEDVYYANCTPQIRCYDCAIEEIDWRRRMIRRKGGNSFSNAAITASSCYMSDIA